MMHLYDAFICYSRKDEKFAKKLEVQLERYRLPKGFEFDKRRLNIFRDVQDLVGNELSTSIKEALKDSEFLIVICSPNSRKSKWVGKEIKEFAELHSRAKIIPVLISGRPNPEVRPEDALQDQAFPDVLYEYFDEPLAADYRFFHRDTYQQRRTHHREAKFQILAFLFAKEKEELLNRQRKRAIKFLSLTIVGLVILSVAFAWISYNAIKARKEAERQTRVSRTALANNYWSNAVNAKEKDDWLAAAHFAALCARSTLDESQTKASIFTIYYYLNQAPFLKAHIEHEKNSAFILSKDERLLLTYSKDGTARLWNTDDGTPASAPMKHDHPIDHVILSDDESLILTYGSYFSLLNLDASAGSARLWYAKDGSPATPPMKHRKRINGAIFNKDQSLILTYSEDGTAQLWNTNNGSPAAAPLKHEESVAFAMFNEEETRILTVSNLYESWNPDRYKGFLRIWNVNDGSLAAPPMVHNRPVSSATFSRDGSLILTHTSGLGDKVNAAYLWKTETGSLAIPPIEHEGSVSEVMFDKDQNRIITFGDNRIYFWNTNDGTSATSPIELEIQLNGAIFNKDQSLILTYSDDGTAQLWNTKDGSSSAEPMRHKSSVWGGKFNSDESLILTYGEDRARLWNTKDGSPAGKAMEHGGDVFNAVFSSDESLILTYGLDGKVRIWDSRDGSLTLLPMRYEKSVDSAIFTSDGGFAVTAGDDGIIRLWQIEGSLAKIPPMKHDNEVHDATFNKDESLILTRTGSLFSCEPEITCYAAQIWHTKDGSPATPPMVHNKKINGAIFSPDESLILTYSEDRTIRLWNARDGSPMGKPMKHDQIVLGATFNKNGSSILSYSGDNYVGHFGPGAARLWSTGDSSLVVPPMRHSDYVLGAKFNNDESLILSYGADGLAQLWHSNSGLPASSPMLHKRHVNLAIFSPDESLILTASGGAGGGSLHLWNAKDGSRWKTNTMKHDGNWINGAIFNKNGSLILSYGDDGTARLWYSKDGLPAAKPMKHERRINGVIFSKDENLILTYSDDGTARLWHSKDGSPAAKPMKHDRRVRGAVFNKDESLVLTYGEDGARLWNTENGSPVGKPMAHGQDVFNAVFSSDESLILTYGPNAIVQLWNARDGWPATKPMKHEKAVWGAKFNADESLILSHGGDGTARLWSGINADYDFPSEHLHLLVEVLTGTIINENNEMKLLSREEWNLRKRSYLKIAKEHLRNCEYKDANIYLNRRIFSVCAKSISHPIKN